MLLTTFVLKCTDSAETYSTVNMIMLVNLLNTAKGFQIMVLISGFLTIADSGIIIALFH